MSQLGGGVSEREREKEKEKEKGEFRFFFLLSFFFFYNDKKHPYYSQSRLGVVALCRRGGQRVGPGVVVVEARELAVVWRVKKEKGREEVEFFPFSFSHSVFHSMLPTPSFLLFSLFFFTPFIIVIKQRTATDAYVAWRRRRAEKSREEGDEENEARREDGLFRFRSSNEVTIAPSSFFRLLLSPCFPVSLSDATSAGGCRERRRRARCKHEM